MNTRAVMATAFVALALVGFTRPATAELSIVDAHIHYSEPDWRTISTERALTILAQAGVRRALVSSTPDDGTVKLYEAAPARIVPFLRPYRTPPDMSTGTRAPAVAAYVEQRLTRGIYKGIGEFHMSPSDVDAPVVKRFAELAVERGLFLHAHVDDVTIDRLAAAYPKTRFLWAHAGMSAPPSTVGARLDRFPNVWVELALRSDVAPGGTLDPSWRQLFLRHADRFMVGTDTWVTSRWDAVVDGVRDVEAWLHQLPPDVAEKIANANADRLFPPP